MEANGPEERARLPLFPLNTPLVPGLVLPLHVFEPRYRQLVASLLAIEDEDAREFGIIAVRDGRDADRDGREALYDVGTATALRQAEELPDGRYDIVTTGTRRFRLLSVDRSQPLAVAEVAWLDDPDGDLDPRLPHEVARAFAAYRSLLGGGIGVGTDGGSDDGIDAEDGDGIDELPGDPALLSYLVTAALVLPVRERQELLEAHDTAARLRLARRVLRRENGLIATLRALPALDLSPGYASAN